jgi:hypothetical protein
MAKWSRIVLVLVLAILSLEVAAFLILKIVGVYPTESFTALYQNSSCFKANEFNFGRHAKSTQVDVMMTKIPHPFFGFTENPERASDDGRDLMVSANHENDLRYRIRLGRDPRPANVFTIGIFGASVAGGFADFVTNDPFFRDELKRRIPRLRDKEIIIRNMAIGSSRQPTQLAVAVHYLELFDMTINLDGYSELAIIMHPEYPIEFPMFGDIFYSVSGPPLYLNLLAAQTVCNWISRLPEQVPLLAYSNVYYLLWYNASKRIDAAFFSAPEPKRPSNDAFTTDEVRRLYAEYFKRYTLYQHQILSANGIPAYFFLQPNQYVPDSKRFTDEERATALGYRDKDEIAARYALFREATVALRERGVQAHDLTMSFADVDDTIYIDSCCHVNARGNRILAEKIADIIARAEVERSG